MSNLEGDKIEILRVWKEGKSEWPRNLGIQEAVAIEEVVDKEEEGLEEFNLISDGTQ